MQAKERFHLVTACLGDHFAMAVVMETISHHPIVTCQGPQATRRERAQFIARGRVLKRFQDRLRQDDRRVLSGHRRHRFDIDANMSARPMRAQSERTARTRQ